MSGTLNEQLNQIADTKCAIADAINSKGIEVSENDPFATYASKIKQIQGGEGGNAFNLFDIKIADHKLEGNEALGWALQGTAVTKNDYPDFYERCLKEFNSSTLLDNIYINDNGHKYYDISYKSTIDAEFEQTGMAWFYGVDTTEERIFLPRNNYFEQMTGDVAQVGDSVEAGLPNITGYGIQVRTLSDEPYNETSGAIYYNKNNGDLYGTGGVDSHVGGFDASRSNPIYGKSNTVQPNAVKKLLYICVGNTVVDESTIDISKEIELNNPFFLGQSQYFENEPNNLSWLKSTGEFHSKSVYPSMYEYISKNIKAGTKDFVDVNGEVNDYCYVIDEQNETFRLPLLNGSESIPGTEYINLSELSTGDELIAPRNGQYIYRNKLNKAGGYFYLANITSGDYSVGTSSVSTHNMSACVAAHRGDIIRYVTDLTNATITYFRFIPYVGNGSLYYYVGEAINNAQLVDLGKITAEMATKVDINSDRFDGAWVSKNIALAGSGGASFSSSNVVYDLSEYLPNDGYNYEVIVSSYISTAAKSGSYACVYIGSDIMTSSIYLSACITRTSSNAQTAGSVVCPVGYGRYIFVEGTSSSGSYSLYVRGYRRLGKI